MIIQFLLPHLYIFLLKGWENILFGNGSERVELVWPSEHLVLFICSQAYFQSGTKGKSYLTVEWTNQHGGGSNYKLNSNLVLQFMCQPDSKNGKDKIRNGASTATQQYSKPPTNENSGQYSNRKNNNIAENKVLQESWEWYDSCYQRDRNKGLTCAKLFIWITVCEVCHYYFFLVTNFSEFWDTCRTDLVIRVCGTLKICNVFIIAPRSIAKVASLKLGPIPMQCHSKRFNIVWGCVPWLLARTVAVPSDFMLLLKWAAGVQSIPLQLLYLLRPI